MRTRGIHCGWGMRARLAAVLCALGLMLAAVLPHATVAASLTESMPQMTAVAADKPCHESEAGGDSGTVERPACCFAGCGTLAPAPVPPAVPAVARWQALRLATMPSARGLTPDPGERPPRSIA